MTSDLNVNSNIFFLKKENSLIKTRKDKGIQVDINSKLIKFKRKPYQGGRAQETSWRMLDLWGRAMLLWLLQSPVFDNSESIFLEIREIVWQIPHGDSMQV